MVDRWDVLVWGGIGVAIAIAILSYIFFVAVGLFWVIDVINGVPNPIDLFEILGLFLILGSIFGGSTVVKSE